MAHARELSTDASKVEAAFVRWRSGEIDAFALSDEVHRIRDGPPRRLYTTYSSHLPRTLRVLSERPPLEGADQTSSKSLLGIVLLHHHFVEYRVPA
jgi:hypothetical protein